jgi:hypothetical protein
MCGSWYRYFVDDMWRTNKILQSDGTVALIISSNTAPYAEFLIRVTGSFQVRPCYRYQQKISDFVLACFACFRRLLRNIGMHCHLLFAVVANMQLSLSLSLSHTHTHTYICTAVSNTTHRQCNKYMHSRMHCELLHTTQEHLLPTYICLPITIPVTTLSHGIHHTP